MFLRSAEPIAVGTWVTPRPYRQAPLGRHLCWFDGKIANGLIEGTNSLVQAAKAKARGYRSIRNLKTMVYLLAAKLDLRLPP
jgi:hypothetical protein